jgi:hypothetical protein
VKAKSSTAKSLSGRSATRAGARRAKPATSAKPAKSAGKAASQAGRKTARRAAGKPTGKRAGSAGKATRKRAGGTGRAAGRRASGHPAARRRTGAPARRASAGARRAPGARWLAFVEQHGVVLASARGPVPSVAEAVAGQPIIGSWWAHPKGKVIFAALSELDDSDDVRCFKLIDGKVTFVHRRMWPALACLAGNGAIAAERAAAIQQEHMPTGEHRNLVTPYPDWVPDDVARDAAALTVEAARALLGAWL